MTYKKNCNYFQVNTCELCCAHIQCCMGPVHNTTTYQLLMINPSVFNDTVQTDGRW